MKPVAMDSNKKKKKKKKKNYGMLSALENLGSVFLKDSFLQRKCFYGAYISIIIRCRGKVCVTSAPVK